MKRILFFSHSLELGGAERSLIGLLNSIDPTEYSIDLFLMRHTGALLQSLPPYINLLPEIPAYASLAVPLSTTISKRQYGVACGRYYGKLKATRYIKKHKLGENAVALEYSHKYTKRFMPKIGEGIYDLAVSFLTPHYFVAEKVQAKKTAAWIHTDYGNVAVDAVSELEMWNAYNYIVAVSDTVLARFVSVFPSLEHKVTVIENILPRDLIWKQAQEYSVQNEMPNDGTIRLLSVGRFSYAKNFDSIPEICALIRLSGLNVVWYLIGFGGEEVLIRQRIREYGMEKHVIILGKKENPYPYIANCDLYVQPSRYEGKAVTVREAQTLGKPVVITAYPTSNNQLQNGVDGVIAPMSCKGCARAIETLLIHPSQLHRISDNCLKRDYSNVESVSSVYRMVNDSYGNKNNHLS